MVRRMSVLTRLVFRTDIKTYLINLQNESIYSRYLFSSECNRCQWNDPETNIENCSRINWFRLFSGWRLNRLFYGEVSIYRYFFPLNSSIFFSICYSRRKSALFLLGLNCGGIKCSFVFFKWERTVWNKMFITYWINISKNYARRTEKRMHLSFSVST